MLDNKKNDILRVLSIDSVDFETVAYELYHIIFIATPIVQCQELFQYFCTQFDRMDKPFENHGYTLNAPVSLVSECFLEDEEAASYIRKLLAITKQFPADKFLEAVEMVYQHIRIQPAELRFSNFLLFLQSGFFPYGKGYTQLMQVNDNAIQNYQDNIPVCELYEHLLWMRGSDPDSMINLTVNMLDLHQGDDNILLRREILDILAQRFMEIGEQNSEIENTPEGPSGKFKQGLDYFAKAAVSKNVNKES